MGFFSRATVFQCDMKLRTSVYRNYAWFPSVTFKMWYILALSETHFFALVHLRLTCICFRETPFQTPQKE